MTHRRRAALALVVVLALAGPLGPLGLVGLPVGLPGSPGPGGLAGPGGPGGPLALFAPAPAAAATAPASPGSTGPGAGPAQATTPVPCVGARWGSCDTRATDNGYQYRYRGGILERVPVGGSGGTRAGCGNDCPPDPLEACGLLAALGPSPTMSPAERAEYDAMVAPCQVWFSGNPGVPVGQVQAELADYLREELLPTPAVTVQPTGNTFANLPTILHTPVPESFTFNVEEPVVATISAIPHYRWDFGDGEFGPDSPGRPYDPAISPRDHPDAYVAHSYARPGTYQVTLTVTWNGVFTVPGVAEVFPLPPVVLIDTVEVVVEEASGVLVEND